MERRGLAAFLTACCVTALAAVAAAEDEGAERPTADEPGDADPKTICELVEAAAADSDIPIDFFTRLLWTESSFRVDAVSPKGAQGIAQFMPGTAALRGLADPFDAASAIAASAAYLSELSRRYGNLGLAAAAYNAGERRVDEWIGGSGGLPLETRDYVFKITGRDAEEWTLGDAAVAPAPGNETETASKEAETASDDGTGEARGCLELLAELGRPGAGARRVASSLASAPWAPWGVQVAANFSASRAMASYARLQGRHPDVLAEETPMIVRSVNRSRGNAALFNIRVPAESREAASEICRRLRSAGAACLVMKN